MISARRAHVAYLLASPTRSSYVGFIAQESLADMIAAMNADESDSPLSILRPWRLAATAQRESPEAAEAVAAAVSRASGFRARLAAMRALADAEGPALSQGGPRLDASRALDGMTYAMIEVANPEEPDRCIRVRALVDTGSTDCELKGRWIEELDLRPDTDAGFATFETASGVQTTAQVYRASVRAHGREALCLLSPAEASQHGDDDGDEGSSDGGDAGGVEDIADGADGDDVDARFGFDDVSDEALLGHDALAALGLAVDCSGRRLFAVVPT